MTLYDDSIKLKILNNEVDLDCRCWACDGDKPDETWKNEDGSCSKCNGTGFQLTDAGDAIMDLVKRHTKKKITIINV